MQFFARPLNPLASCKISQLFMASAAKSRCHAITIPISIPDRANSEPRTLILSISELCLNHLSSRTTTVFEKCVVEFSVGCYRVSGGCNSFDVLQFMVHSHNPNYSWHLSLAHRFINTTFFFHRFKQASIKQKPRYKHFKAIKCFDQLCDIR